MFEAEMNKIVGAQKKTEMATKGIGKQFGQWTVGLGKAAVGMVGLLGTTQTLLTVAQLARKEFDAMVTQQEKAAGRQVEFSDAIDQIRYQLPVTSDVTTDQIRQQILDSKTPSPVATSKAVVGAISAGLNIPVSERVKLGIKLSEMRPDLANEADQETLQKIIEASVVQSRAFDQSPEAAMGMITTAMSASRQTNPKQFVDNIAPLAFKLKDLGFTQQQGMAMGAAYSSAIEDSEGQTSATNVLEFASQIHEELRKRGRKETGEDMLRFVRSDNPEAESIRSYLGGVMRADLEADGMSKSDIEKAMQHGTGHLRGRTKGKFAFYAFLTNASKMTDAPESFAELYESAKSEIPLNSKVAEDLIRRRREESRADPYNQTRELKSLAEGFKSRIELSDPSYGMTAVAADMLDTVYQGTKGLSIQSDIEGLKKRLEGRTSTPQEILSDLSRNASDRARELMMNELHENPNRSQAEVQEFARRNGLPIEKDTDYWRAQDLYAVDHMTDAERAQLEQLERIATEISELKKATQKVVVTNPRSSEPAPAPISDLGGAQ